MKYFLLIFFLIIQSDSSSSLINMKNLITSSLWLIASLVSAHPGIQNTFRLFLILFIIFIFWLHFFCFRTTILFLFRVRMHLDYFSYKIILLFACSRNWNLIGIKIKINNWQWYVKPKCEPTEIWASTGHFRGWVVWIETIWSYLQFSIEGNELKGMVRIQMNWFI